MPPLLAIEDLTVAFPAAAGGWTPVVRGASLSIDRGEFIGLVGESGSGKSVTALAVLRLVPPPGRILAGRVRLAGEDLLALSEAKMRQVRGARIGLVFQEPMTALNPVFTVGFQIAEAVRVHRRLSRRKAREEAVRLLELVAMPDPRQRLDAYPHQLSGGQRQRVMIAIALAAGPELLIADEPTTALDVTIQAQILELLQRLSRELGLTVLLITHDLAVVAETCRRVFVMYAGEVVEEALVAELFATPAHPYTQGLLRAIPRLGHPPPDRLLAAIPGQVPDPAHLPVGCPFRPRCPEAMAICAERAPDLVTVGASTGRLVRCFLYGDSAAAAAPRTTGGSAADVESSSSRPEAR